MPLSSTFSRPITPPSSGSSLSLSLHQCSLCADDSGSIPISTKLSEFPSSNSSFLSRRLYNLQSLIITGTLDIHHFLQTVCPSKIDIEDSHHFLAKHILKTHLPPTSYLSQPRSSDLQDALHAWDTGCEEIQLARDLRDGQVTPASSGGCWPARVSASDEGNATIFVGGLTGEGGELYLEAIFAVFGPYTGVSVLRHFPFSTVHIRSS